MADNISLLAVFPDLAPAADAIDKLRALGLSDDQMNVISGIPVTEAMLGRPHQWTNVPRLAAGVGRRARACLGHLVLSGKTPWRPPHSRVLYSASAGIPM